MSAPLNIQVRCVAVPATLRAGGLRCFAQVVIDETLFVDGLAVRVTQGGKAIVTWPERRDREGRLHTIVRILDEVTRVAMEKAVLDEAVRGGSLEKARIRPVIGAFGPVGGP